VGFPARLKKPESFTMWVEVDPVLEIAEIADRVSKMKRAARRFFSQSEGQRVSTAVNLLDRTGACVWPLSAGWSIFPNVWRNFSPGAAGSLDVAAASCFEPVRASSLPAGDHRLFSTWNQIFPQERPDDRRTGGNVPLVSQ
jgi:3-polyprenyl-4-hydroxybenzoate decarboxylase